MMYKKKLILKLLITTVTGSLVVGCQTTPKQAEIMPDMVFPENVSNKISLDVYDQQGFLPTKQTSSSGLNIKRKDKSKKDVVYSKCYRNQLKEGSWFVISIPDDVRQGSARKNTTNVREAESAIQSIDNSSKEDRKEIYSTTGYYNFAENQIEKILVRDGFGVVDRAKFLSRLKEEERTPGMTTVVTDVLSVVPGVANALDEMSEASSFKDVSDVIRSAESDEELKSQYILQINKLSFEKKEAILNLKDFPEIEKYKNDNPDIANKVPDIYRYPEYSVTLDGKLISIKTGRIMWLGTHTINTGQMLAENGKNITISMNDRIYPSNKREIEEFIAFQNTPEQRAARFGKDIEYPKIKYSHSFDFDVTPDLRKIEEEGNEDILQHREDLIKQVVEELISTIHSESLEAKRKKLSLCHGSEMNKRLLSSPKES